jgi:hypothetical protein
LRQTSGALRQTEGSSRLCSARSRRKSAPREALKRHCEARNLAAPKIRRYLKDLFGMRRRGAARTPRGATPNPKAREALKPDRQKRAAPNINVMRYRCDELKAKLRRVFFMRQELAFSRRMRGGGKNAAAMDWRKCFRRFATRR